MQRGLVHRFAEPLPLDDAQARAWLGGKGASVALMTRMGLPVPPGFTLSTEVWRRFEAEGALAGDVLSMVRGEVAQLEQATGLAFGDARKPLLLAVRSGAPSSMPGMLETVLDVGIDAAIERALAEERGSARFALDVRRRFLESYGCAVLGVPREAFDAVLARRDPRELDAHALGGLVADYERLIRHESGQAVPDDPWAQLVTSIEGVLRSWRAARAAQYRAAHGIDEAEGTGVTVQAMVFGNLDERSGAGVVFSRNPTTGERAPWGEWLPRAQGEDVVSGRRTPLPLTSAQVRRGMRDESLEASLPATFSELREFCERLEERFGDAVDVELTVEDGRLYVLQCRPAKRTARAAARIAVEMQVEGTLDRSEALARVEPASLRQLLTPRLPDPQALAAGGVTPIARGLAASPGAAVGRVALDANAAAALGAGEEIILVRAETSAEDVETMRAVAGVLTAAGGLTSHAAVVARAMGKPCVAGATSLHVDYARRLVIARSETGSTELREGDTITIDGARGLVYATAVAVEPAPASPHVETLLGWADAIRSAKVLAVAGSARLARVGVSFGADGVLAGESESAEAVVEAAGALPVWLVANGEDTARRALPALRPGVDVLVTDAWAALREEARSRGVRLGAVASEQGPELDALVLDVPDVTAAARITALSLPENAEILLRGEAAVSPVALGALSGRSLWLAVPPLEVPGARLCAARAV